MYSFSKIGVGIVTCNRKDSYKRLFEKVQQNSEIDVIVTVKNKEFDYEDCDPTKQVSRDENQIYKSFNVKEDLGVGYCKNLCLKELLKEDCKHLFLIEDDIDIKRDDVFRKYIATAGIFNLHHLNFCMAWDSITKKYLTPSYSVAHPSGFSLSIFDRLCGDFEYFTSDVILQAGLFDAKHYINALEHAEHTYRIASLGLTTPFYAFADIYHSNEYLEDTGIESSIHHDAASQQLYQ